MSAMKNNKKEVGTAYLEDDSNNSKKKQYRYWRLDDDDVRKKSLLGRILTFFQKWFYFLVLVLLVIAILLIGMTYIKVSKYASSGMGQAFDLDCQALAPKPYSPNPLGLTPTKSQ